MCGVFIFLYTASCVCALATNQATETAKALLLSGEKAVQLLLTLLGSMTLWNGLLEILNTAGDVARFGRVIRRILKPIFPGIQDDACWSAMGMNLSANLLGLGNAATPAGVRAAELLARQGEPGLRALAMLLALNNAGFQLLPTTVISLRSAAGAANPSDIWLPTLAVSAGATLSACLLMGLVNRGGAHRG